MKTFRSHWLTAEAGVLLFLGVFAFGVVTTVGTTEVVTTSVVTTSVVPGRGQQIFQREGCLFCHSLPGYRPTPQPLTGSFAFLQRVGTSWSRNGPDLALEPGRRTDDWHLAHLLDPTAVLPGCPMPSYAGLADDELRALIAFLQTPRGEETRVLEKPGFLGVQEATRFLGETGLLSIPPTRASYLAGREIYRAYCAGCHGMEGNGAGPAGHLLWPEPRDFTDTAWMRKRSDAYLLDAIGRGKPDTAMPGYAGPLTPEEQALVLYYLKFYTNPSARQSLEEGFVTQVP